MLVKAATTRECEKLFRERLRRSNYKFDRYKRHWRPAPLRAIAVVQAASLQSVGTSTQVNLTTTSGNLIVAIVYTDVSNGALLGVTDSASQSWSQVGTTFGVGNSAFAMFYLPNAAAVTFVTGTCNVSGTLPVVVYEISGIATSSPLDGFVISSGAGSLGSLASGSLSTVNASDILLYGVGENVNQTGAGFVAGSGYAIQTNGQLQTGRAAIQFKIVAATQSGTTTTMTLTSPGGDRDGIFAAFSSTPVAAGGPTLAALDFTPGAGGTAVPQGNTVSY